MQFDSENTETVDEEVLTAGQAAMESGRMTPLLKVGLPRYHGYPTQRKQ
jgi:hypothetical protein